VTTGEINWEYVQWGLLFLAPFLAVFTAKGVYNAVSLSRQKERRHEQDLCHDLEYLHWWGAVEAHRGIHSVFCPFPIEDDETCYMFSSQVPVYFPDSPGDGPDSAEDGDEGTSFDVELGISVAPDWSVMDWFPSVGFKGLGTLCVTNRRVYLQGAGFDLRIDLADIHTVSAACSSVLIGCRDHAAPLILGSVNGQVIRDVLHLLVEGDGTLPAV